ncbi:MAG TPA: sigma-70 family RNA polymerase sigma factor [Bryobacteraceae bacterium]|nr:sigma-70 family RNA polymerase sigma factor [Bryobacteraceae bacterium]
MSKGAAETSAPLSWELTIWRKDGSGKAEAGAKPATVQSRLELFEEIILPHLNAAYNLARWLTHNPQDAEDVVQEAYLRAFRFFDGYRGADGKSWLLAIVRNTCRSWQRRQSRDGYNLLHWTSGAMTYWAISDLSLTDLQEFRKLYR